jgi:hypothetical protein
VSLLPCDRAAVCHDPVARLCAARPTGASPRQLRSSLGFIVLQSSRSCHGRASSPARPRIGPTAFSRRSCGRMSCSRTSSSASTAPKRPPAAPCSSRPSACPGGRRGRRRRGLARTRAHAEERRRRMRPGRYRPRRRDLPRLGRRVRRGVHHRPRDGHHARLALGARGHRARARRARGDHRRRRLSLVQWFPESALQLLVGSLLLVFGLQWLRKAILRSAAGPRSRSGDDVAGAEHSKGDSGGDDAVEDDQPERGTPGELVVSAGGERVQRAAG